MVRLIPLVLCATFLLGGCRGTRVSVMGWEPKKPVMATELTTEEKAGVILILRWGSRPRGIWRRARAARPAQAFVTISRMM